MTMTMMMMMMVVVVVVVVVAVVMVVVMVTMTMITVTMAIWPCAATQIEFLISQGADVTHQSLQEGRSALSIAAATLNTAACRLLLDAGAPPSPVTWSPVDDEGPPRIEAECPLFLALMIDSYKVPESETAVLIRSRMMSGSDHDRTMVRVVDWALLYHKMVTEYQSYSRPEDPKGSAPPRGGREGAEEAIAQIQGMADWMASHAGVEAPDDAAGNPLLLIHRCTASSLLLPASPMKSTVGL